MFSVVADTFLAGNLSSPLVLKTLKRRDSNPRQAMLSIVADTFLAGNLSSPLAVPFTISAWVQVR